MKFVVCKKFLYRRVEYSEYSVKFSMKKQFTFYGKGSNFDFTLIRLKSSMYDIRNNSKRIWIETGDLIITSKFSKNIFKPGSNEGSIVAELNPEFLNIVQNFERKIKAIFLEKFGGKPISGIMMTRDTIDQIFKSVSDPMRISCDPASCVVLNDGISLEGVSGIGNFVVEPSYLWIMNGRIGVRWNARQIRIISNTIMIIPDDEGGEVEGDGFGLNTGLLDSDSDSNMEKEKEKEKVKGYLDSDSE